MRHNDSTAKICPWIHHNKLRRDLSIVFGWSVVFWCNPLHEIWHDLHQSDRIGIHDDHGVLLTWNSNSDVLVCGGDNQDRQLVCSCPYCNEPFTVAREGAWVRCSRQHRKIGEPLPERRCRGQLGLGSEWMWLGACRRAGGLQNRSDSTPFLGNLAMLGPRTM